MIVEEVFSEISQLRRATLHWFLKVHSLDISNFLGGYLNLHLGYSVNSVKILRFAISDGACFLERHLLLQLSTSITQLGSNVQGLTPRSLQFTFKVIKVL